MHLKLLVFSAIITTCHCVQLPSNFKQCNKTQKDFNACLKTALEDVLARGSEATKTLGIPVLDPLEIPQLTIGAGNGAVHVEQNYKNLKITGNSKMKCAEVAMDFQKKIFLLDCSSPAVIWDFDYDVNGRILVLPIQGKGPGSVTMERVNIKMSFYLEEYTRKGKKHFKVANQTTAIIPELMKFDLKNLFGGDKLLGDQLNKVINENWKILYEDVVDLYQEAMGRVYGAIFNNVLDKVSVKELFGND